MEEILASIRRIIADDEVKPAEASAPAPAPEAPPVPPQLQLVEEIDDDVLDLGAEASLVASPAMAEPEPPGVAIQPGLDVDFIEAAEPEFKPEFKPEPKPEPPAQMFVPPAFVPAQSAPPSLDMAALISEQAGSAVNNAFGALAHTVLSNNARTLEDLVKDMLKPMLKTWLDDNLPTMVERLVRAEIERVARGNRH
ncbi:hypothetical protein BIWAKO_04542 [Bosea sp. BIWAKO-01]|nr:hypothetical protein BIWAKO_04542 [Bosea sp. BIWAKO-01]